MKIKFGCYSGMAVLAALCAWTQADAQLRQFPVKVPMRPGVDNTGGKKNTTTGTMTPVAPVFSGYLGMNAGLRSNVNNAGGTGGNTGFVNLGTRRDNLGQINLGQINLGVNFGNNIGTGVGLVPGGAFVNPGQGLPGGVGGVNLGGLNNLGGVNLGVNNLGLNLGGVNNLGLNLGGINNLGVGGVNNFGLNLGGVNNLGLNQGLNVGAFGNLGGINFQNAGNFGNPFLQIGGIPR